MRASGRIVLAIGLGLLAAAVPARAAPRTALAWTEGGVAHALEGADAPRTVDARTLRTPLGSTWKLFVHSYLHAHGAQEPAYRCDARTPREHEEYCCDPGGSVTRDEALARSCGPYFEPARLGITADAWKRHWRGRDAPAWLQSLDQLRPATELPVADLLQALDRIAPAQRVAAREALLPVSLRHEALFNAVGSGPRFKTWSWHTGGDRIGGAAGWRADGTPFWFGAPGTSRTALESRAAWLAALPPFSSPAQADSAAAAAQPCVQVRFFERYPIRAVERGDGAAAADGALAGRHIVRFENGTVLPIVATPAMQLRSAGPHRRIVARLSLEDYVARVVDREGSARETQAARALAIATRTYVLQNASEDDGCRHITDDSRTQRVSPNPPTVAARNAAAFTEGVTLAGVAVRYHADQASAGVMSWKAAVESARRGDDFIDILRTAYPGATLAGAKSGEDCEPLADASAWLMQRQSHWRRTLRAEAGYQPVDGELQVCRLAMGTPHADQRRGVIRIREWHTREGRVTLIHEYLHLAFRHHPKGRDEDFIERLARRLADT